MTSPESPYDPEFTNPESTDPEFYPSGLYGDYFGEKDPTKLAETFRKSSSEYAGLFNQLVTRLAGKLKPDTFDDELEAISKNLKNKAKLSSFLDDKKKPPVEDDNIKEVARIDMAREIASTDLTRAIRQLPPQQLPKKYKKDGFAIEQVRDGFVRVGRSTWQANEFMPQAIEVHSYDPDKPVVVDRKFMGPGHNPSLEYVNQPDLPDPDINWLNLSLAESSLVMQEWLKLDDDQLKQTLKI